MKINLKAFTPDELMEWIESSGSGNDVFFKNKPMIVAMNEVVSISDHLNMQVYKGSENLYVDFSIWRGDDVEVEIELYTKDNHERLKEVIIELIKQA